MTSFESIKALEIKTSIGFNLDFTDNTISPCFFFLIIYLQFSIPAVITQIFNPITKLVVPIGIPTKEGKAEMEVEVTISKSSIKFKTLQIILCFLLINLF